ncbi:TcfC E-set like domain-containing protein [Photobacterium damselae]|uniref:TcfC E-set like domain-containing protein n=1 Tax=Photobacterium damselae TaxID=38293 RepID=UPI0030F3D4E3
MKYSLFTFLVSSIFIGSPVSASNQYPLEFADFFEEQNDLVEIVIAGDIRSQQIQALVSYESFQLDSADKNSIHLLTRYLKDRKLTTKAVDSIIKQLSLGIDANPGCSGVLSLCVPKDIPGQAEFVFNFDSKQLNIFISPEMLGSMSDGDEYYSSLRSNNALINWSDMYAYIDKDGSSQFNWTNNALLGLPVGFISLETQYNNSERELAVYQSLYDVEIGAHRGLIGYQGQNSMPLNTTDFLGFGADYSGIGFSVGSSKNLLKGNKQAQQRIYFYAPQSAQLEVYQGNRLLLSKVVSAGEQSIGYDQLPSGIYTLQLILKQGSNELFNELRQVVNTQQFSLSVGDWDYRIDSGYLKDINYRNDDLDDIANSERLFARGAASYRPVETLLVAGSVTSGGDDALMQMGGFWVLGDKFNMQYTAGLFSSGDSYQYGQMVYEPFTASFRHINSSASSSALVRLLYGDDTITELGLGVSGNVLGGVAYLSYFNYQIDDGLVDSDSDNISFTWSRDLFGGQFSMSTTYSHYDNTQESLSTNLSWTYKLGSSLTGRVGMYADMDGFSYNLNNLTYQHSDEDWFASTTAGIKLGREGNSEAEWSASTSGHTDKARYSAYGYVNSNGQRSISANVSGTQILSLNGGALTHEQGRSFVSIDPDFTAPSKEKDIKIKYDIIRDGQYLYRDYVSASKDQMVDLSPYSEVAFELNAETDNVDIENKDYRHFVLPGTYYQLDSKVIPLLSQNFVLNDMFGNPIPSVRCIGDGCKSVEPLSDDGVYRVNFRKNMPFKLVSDKRLCVYNPDLMGEQYVTAYCLPGLDNIDDNIVWADKPNIIAHNDMDRALLYIGKYESTVKAKQILARLKEVGLDSKSIEVGAVQYVYVRYLDKYTTAQRSLLESLDAYVILDTIKIDQLFSVR